MAHRYYVNPKRIISSAATLTLDGEEAAHLSRVLRAKPGERITAFDGTGMRYECCIQTVSQQEVTCQILSSQAGCAEPDIAVTLYVGYPKSDKLEHIIQKATELGAIRIVPFFSRFCVAAPKKEEQKNERYRRIALEAAKQSGRDVIPRVELPLTFDEMLQQLPDYDAALFCYEAQPDSPGLNNLIAGAGTVAIITGSEGGFDEKEAEKAAAVSTPISLGPRILRCETAPLATLCAVMTLSGNL